MSTQLLPLDPPQDSRIYNRKMPDGTFRPLAGYFDSGKAVEQLNAVDKCPSCGGSGKEVPAFLHGAKCIDCDGTGICH